MSLTFVKTFVDPGQGLLNRLLSQSNDPGDILKVGIYIALGGFEMTTLQSYLVRVLTEYQNQKEHPFKDNDLANFIRHDASGVITSALFDPRKFSVKASAGQGRWAEIPWLAIFNNAVSTSATKGYYLVYLFRADCKGVFLSLNQGYTAYLHQFSHQNPSDKVSKVSKYWAAKLGLVNDQNNRNGFSAAQIDLHGRKDSVLATGYEHGNIFCKYYSLESLAETDDSHLMYDLEYMKMVFDRLTSSLPQNFEQFNYNVVYNISTVELDHTIKDQQFDPDSETGHLGKEVPVPKHLERPRVFTPGTKISKRNYVKELKRNTKQGMYTENKVMEIEEARLRADSRLSECIGTVRHISVDEGDGAGYDIASFDYDQERHMVVPRYVEVKSTTGDILTPFYMTENELLVSQRQGPHYFIYRLFKSREGKWNYYIIQDPAKNTSRRPIQYVVMPN